MASLLAGPSLALVNFGRLMRSCDGLAHDLGAEERRRRLCAYVPVLQALWRELESTSECSRDDLDEYARKVERLAELLDEEKLARGGAAGALAGTRANSNGRLTRGEANAELSSRLSATTRVQQALRAQLMQSGEPARGADGPPAPRPLATTAQPAAAPAAVGAAVGAAAGTSALDALLARAAAGKAAAGGGVGLAGGGAGLAGGDTGASAAAGAPMSGGGETGASDGPSVGHAGDNESYCYCVHYIVGEGTVPQGMQVGVAHSIY